MVSAILAFFRGPVVRLAPATWADATLESGVEVGATRLLEHDRIPPATRRALAARWREQARAAHASVAGRAHLAADLVALGAPPALVIAANRDALDGVRWAELSFAVARGIDGDQATTKPGPTTCLRFRSVTRLAIDSALDACAPRVASKLARRAVDPVIRSVLEEIGACERRREKHAIEVLRWCLADAELAPIMEELGDECCASEVPDDVRAGGWERWGIAGAALEQRACEAARERVFDVIRTTNLSRAEAAAGRAA
jgi:hypothetical protein